MRCDNRHLICGTALLAIFFYLSCGKTVLKNDRDGTAVIPDRRDSATAGSNDFSLEKKYITEGFIRDDLYRVVIVSTREECEGSTQEIGEKSRMRAMVSLEKYLSSQDRRVDGNSRVKIRELLGQYGRFIRKDDRCGEKNIYYFEIEKNDLRGYVNSISRR